MCCRVIRRLRRLLIGSKASSMCVAIRHVWALRILTKTKRPGAISTSKSRTEKTPTTKTPNKKHKETPPVAQNLKLTTK